METHQHGAVAPRDRSAILRVGGLALAARRGASRTCGRVVVNPSCAGRSASKTRVNALMTRASIFFAKTLYEDRWIASQLGLARVAHSYAPQVGYTRLAVSSPAMTAWMETRPILLTTPFIHASCSVGASRG